MTRKKIILVSVLFVSFITSMVFYFSNNKRYTRVTYKFNYELSDKEVFEDRYIILKGSSADKLKVIVKELFLGPMSVFNKKIVPFDFRYNSLVYKNGIAYLDLPESIVTYNMKNYFSLEDSLELIKENILLNCNFIQSVIITINGSEIGSGPLLSELPHE